MPQTFSFTSGNFQSAKTPAPFSAAQAAGFCVYRLGYGLFSLGYLPVFFQKIRQEPSPGRLLKERLGFFSKETVERLSDKKILWLHAVSLGEVMAVRGLVEMLLQSLPGFHLVLTTVTPAGQKIARKIDHPRVTTLYFPLDWAFCCKRFFNLLKPQALLLAETEIWPNLLKEAGRRKIPVGVLNARLSGKSTARYGKLGFFTRPLFGALDFVLAQTSEDRDRFIRLGVPESRVEVLGNMKFDNVVLKPRDIIAEQSIRTQWGVLFNDLVWICGSTHPQEEDILLEVFGELRSEIPDLKMILAPRHIERSNNLLKKSLGLGFETVLSTERKPGDSYEVLILNQLGILKNLYEIADVAFVGGSLMRRGGQNPIEPAAFRKAIIHGPYIFNFEKIYRNLDQEGGALLVRDGNQLLFAMKRLLANKDEREAIGENAFQLIRGLQGATLRHAEWILEAFTPGFLERKRNGEQISTKLFPQAGGRL